MRRLTIEQAVGYAAWWNRMALEVAVDDPQAHPGLIGHLKAGRAQHDAAERLVGSARGPDASDT